MNQGFKVVGTYVSSPRHSNIKKVLLLSEWNQPSEKLCDSPKITQVVHGGVRI